MWRSVEPAPLPVPTGTIPLVSNPICLDRIKVNANPALASACACVSATNATINATNTYIGQVEKYNRDLEVYTQQATQQANWTRCANDGVCIDEYSSYQSDYNDNYKNFEQYTKADYPCQLVPELIDQVKKEQCNQYGSGWVPSSDPVKAKCGTSPPTVGDYACCTNKCKRTSEQALQEWKIYFRGKEKEPYPAPLPIKPNVPEYNNRTVIACCSQNFENITAAGDTRIYDITQTCSAEVNDYIQKAASGQTTQPPPNPPGSPGTVGGTQPAPAGLQTFAIVLIAVGVVVFLAIMIWVGVRLRKREAKEATAPPPST